jgi:hypothetical protein
MHVALDFAPGLHGHFLEYILNRYIYSVPASYSVPENIQSIFQSSGSCHPINTDEVYQKNKVIVRGHFSSFNLPIPHGVEKFIFIKHNPRYDFLLLTNIYYRCHPDSNNSTDFNINEIHRLQKELMINHANSDLVFRQNWYAKLYKRHFDFTTRGPKHLDTHDFDFGSFFNLGDFLNEIRKVCDFLSMPFRFDPSLVFLWKEFIQRNQGYHATQSAEKVLESICTGNNVEIPCDWQLHAYINCKLSQIFHLFDGKLFESPDYPTNTGEVHQLVVDHLATFDQRF